MGHLAPGRDVAGLIGTYHIERALSDGPLGRVFVGKKEAESVLLEEVHAADPEAWTRMDLLVREARVSRHLTHPRIPAFVELFAFDGERARAPEALSRATPPERPGEDASLPSLVLVRRFVAGCSIADAIRDGRRFVAPDLERIFRGLLEARRYLDGLLPAVVHGDVSPPHVILGDDGQPSVIGFGAALEPHEDPTLLATVDIHGIALTVLAAASHLPPAQMPRSEREGTVEVARVAPLLSYSMQQALRACLHTEPSRRPQTAAAVLALLDDRWPAARRAAAAATERLRRSRRRVLPALAFVAVAGATLIAIRPLPGPAVELQPLHLEVPEIPSEVVEPPPAGDTTSGMSEKGDSEKGDSETGKSETASSEETPTPSEDTAPKTALLDWSGTVQRATGRVKAGDECLLRLEVAVAGDSPVCTASLTCADQLLIDSVVVEECRLEETAAGDTWTYQAAFWIDGSGTVEGALFGDTGRFHGAIRGQGAQPLESWRIQLAKTSLPRTGEALFEAQRASKEKTIRGTAVATQGKTRAAKGQACTYTLGPNTSASFLEDNGNRCQAKIACGGHLLYDGAGACQAAPGGQPHGYEDSSPSAIDSDPRLAFDGKELTVADIEPTGAWRVTIYLDEDPTESAEN